MKRTVLAVLIVGLVAMLGLTAYAYASGKGPFAGRRAAGCPMAPANDSGSPCPRAAECRQGAQACPRDPSECPCFEDKGGDGRCDHMGKCQCPGSSDCPGPSDCPGHIRDGRGRCGGHPRGCAAAATPRPW